MLPKKSNRANLDNFRGVFFTAGLVISLAAVLLSFEWKSVPEVSRFSEVRIIEAGEDFYIPPTGIEKLLPPPPAKIIGTFEIIGNDKEVVFDPEVLNTEIEEGTFIDILPVMVGNKARKEVEEKIFDHVSQMPEFPGGEPALLMFIQRSLKYPVVAQENGIEGKVYVRFVIDQAGNVNNVQIARGVDSTLDNEALRVISQLPRWKPGMQEGNGVKVWHTVPISFKLEF